MTREEKRKMWAELIQRFRASGQTAAQWCTENDVKLHNLKSWIKTENKAKLTQSNEAKWLALNVPVLKDSANTNPLVVTIGRSSITVQPGFDLKTFQQVTQILNEQC